MTTNLIDNYLTACMESWPIICVHCGSTDVTYSVKFNDAYCEECGRWQLKEEEE